MTVKECEAKETTESVNSSSEANLGGRECDRKNHNETCVGGYERMIKIKWDCIRNGKLCSCSEVR